MCISKTEEEAKRIRSESPGSEASKLSSVSENGQRRGRVAGRTCVTSANHTCFRVLNAQVHATFKSIPDTKIQSP